MIPADWSFSHSQLATWHRCREDYRRRYVEGVREPKTQAMAAGTWLAQEPIEEWIKNGGDDPLCAVLGYKNEPYWDLLWANFLAEWGGNDDGDVQPFYSLKLAKRILAAYQDNPVQGRVVEIERKYKREIAPGITYQSTPDFVVETVLNEIDLDADNNCACSTSVHRITYDIKLKTYNPWPHKDANPQLDDLSPFDDQCLGQAVMAGAQSFGQIRFYVNKKTGALHGPIYLEHPVSEVLAQRWLDSTIRVCREIADYWRLDARVPWPQNGQVTGACRAFGRECHNLRNCTFGG